MNTASRTPILAIAVLLTASITTAAAAETVLVEAESFEHYGGWVLDQQFMDQMGSPYLLAHGLGEPVENAETTVRFSEPGTYRILVRTYDWVARWDAPGDPGRFQLVIDGQPVGTVFGTEGARWHWQDGGTVPIREKRISLALHDLTGFEGRVDAILFTTDGDLVPPNKDPEMARFRRELRGIPAEPEEAGQFDLVVVGGGTAGICASLTAARLGVRVALIQDRPLLGGNNSSEIRVPLKGKTNDPPYPRVGDVMRELDVPQRYTCPYPDNVYGDEKRLALVRAEENISLFLNHRANEVETRSGRIRAVVAQHTKTGRRRRFAGRWFADCTGDGVIGFLADADYEITRTGHMGQSNLWSVADTGSPAPFPRCPWALDLSDKPFPGRDDWSVKSGRTGLEALGSWFWESGFHHDPITQTEYVRDWNFRAMYGAWDCLKNVDGLYPNHEIAWAAYVTGKRESRRLMGDVVLTEQDLLDGREFPDGSVPSSWTIDLHWPDPQFNQGFQGDAFIATSDPPRTEWPYWIPYRCLYSRNVPNLFMAGRDISVTHEALGMVRVMRTTGMMGEIVGMAASLCKEHDADPRAVYQEHLDGLKTLMHRGVGKLPPPVTERPPGWVSSAGPDLARSATVRTTAGTRGKGSASLVNDGWIDVRDNNLRWLGEGPLPHHVELAWDEPQTISAAWIVSGFVNAKGELTVPLRDFALEYHDGSAWQPIPGARAEGNTRIDWQARFDPVTTRRVRLTITATPADVSRIWEIGLYDVPGKR